MKQIFRVTSFFLLLFISVSCKKNNNSKTFSQIYYYEFIGFDDWPEENVPFNDILDDFKNFNYIITKQEVLMPIPLNKQISIDSLSDFHKIIHKVELFSNNTKHSQDDVKMVIRYLPLSENSPAAFQYSRYNYSMLEGWVLKYNLGKHMLTGLPNCREEKIRFLATELARASFK